MHTIRLGNPKATSTPGCRNQYARIKNTPAGRETLIGDACARYPAGVLSMRLQVGVYRLRATSIRFVSANCPQLVSCTTTRGTSARIRSLILDTQPTKAVPQPRFTMPARAGKRGTLDNKHQGLGHLFRRLTTNIFHAL